MDDGFDRRQFEMQWRSGIANLTACFVKIEALIAAQSRRIEALEVELAQAKRYREAPRQPQYVPASETEPDNSEFMTIKDFRRRYRVGTTKLYDLINSGAIEAFKFGSKTLISAKSAEAWMGRLPAFTPGMPPRLDTPMRRPGRPRKYP